MSCRWGWSQCDSSSPPVCTPFSCVPLLICPPGLQYLKERPKEAAGTPKRTLPQRAAEELGCSDPDVQLCYCIEATFMDIISIGLHGT